jgi:hypothetical protein
MSGELTRECHEFIRSRKLLVGVRLVFQARPILILDDVELSRKETEEEGRWQRE